MYNIIHQNLIKGKSIDEYKHCIQMKIKHTIYHDKYSIYILSHTNFYTSIRPTAASKKKK